MKYNTPLIKQIILLSLLLSCTYTGMCQDVFLGTSKDQISNFYIMSITHKPHGITEVFERVKPLDGKLHDFREQVIASRKREKLSTEGFEKVGYYRRRMQYDCSRKAYCVREATYYDLYGKEIQSSDPPNDNPVWLEVPAATMREVEFVKACK